MSADAVSAESCAPRSSPVTARAPNTKLKAIACLASTCESQSTLE